MKKNSIIIIIAAFLIYISYLCCSREFYFIKGIPITMYDKYVIVGRWYMGITQPRYNYIKFSPYADYPVITFHTSKKLSICAPANTEINLVDYECIYFENPTTLPSEKYEDYQRNNSYLFSIDLWWDFGTFFYKFVYPCDNNKYKYIEHGGFWLWDAGYYNLD